MENKRKRILILGASGFIGNALFKELSDYYDTYGTYSKNLLFKENKRFYKYEVTEDDIVPLVATIAPDFIISAIRGAFDAQVQAHQHLLEYIKAKETRLIFLSASNVFDAYSKYPSYEFDKTLSESIYGKLKIRIENQLLRLPKKKYAILRLPMIFGNGSPRIKELRWHLSHDEPIEVFPNLVINTNHIEKLTQQIHYILNRNKTGIFHLGSLDLIHHEELMIELIKRLGHHSPKIKQVFTTNDLRYLAVLPKQNILPKYLQLSHQETINIHIPIKN